MTFSSSRLIVRSIFTDNLQLIRLNISSVSVGYQQAMISFLLVSFLGCIFQLVDDGLLYCHPIEDWFASCCILLALLNFQSIPPRVIRLIQWLELRYLLEYPFPCWGFCQIRPRSKMIAFTLQVEIRRSLSSISVQGHANLQIVRKQVPSSCSSFQANKFKFWTMLLCCFLISYQFVPLNMKRSYYFQIVPVPMKV